MVPKIYLAIDNCFASKRWTEPEKWMEVIHELGISYVEGSADTECDPLYLGEAYIADWIGRVNRAKERFGIHIANLYSGHGTYATLGLAHTDARVRKRFLDEWLKKMVDTAVAVDAGLGFFCHAFSDCVLQEPSRYHAFYDGLTADLAELARYAKAAGARPIAVEQMYTPHQIPWTVTGAKKLLADINVAGESSFYLTIDVGHQNGQRKFLRPDKEELAALLSRCAAGDPLPALWLGSQSALALFGQAAASGGDTARIPEILAEMDRFPYLFAQPEDGDTYHWLRELGCYSPIVHLQQSDGSTSGHWPFTREYNAHGIITPEKVLAALQESFARPVALGMPPRVDEIYLTLEIFTGTADLGRDQLAKIRESVAYWRSFIPQDGLPLDQLVGR